MAKKKPLPPKKKATAAAAKYQEGTWQEMKEDLLHAFGQGHDDALSDRRSLDAKLSLLRSLTKDPQETFRGFLFRVKWVVGQCIGVMGHDTEWVSRL